jgi:hypothetical protein
MRTAVIVIHPPAKADMFLTGRYVETNGIFLKFLQLILSILNMANFLEMH